MVNRALILWDNPSEDAQNSQVGKCVTVNDRLSALGAYLIFKLLGWVLIKNFESYDNISLLDTHFEMNVVTKTIVKLLLSR